MNKSLNNFMFFTFQALAVADVDSSEPMDGETALAAHVAAQPTCLSVISNEKNHHQLIGGLQLLSGANITGNVEIHIHQAPKD